MPFYNFLRKNVPFVWTNECENNFNSIKNYLCSELCLAIFNPDGETIVQTDASLDDIGAILKQKQDDATFKLVAHFYEES